MQLPLVMESLTEAAPMDLALHDTIWIIKAEK